MRIGKLLFIIGIIIVVGLIGFRVYDAMAKNNKPKAVVEKLIPVQVEAVVSRSIQDSISLTGSITADKQVSVASKLPGRILAINVTEGQTISAGQVIAIVETIDVENQLRAAEQSLISANANYQNALSNYERQHKLFDNGLISKKDMEAAELQLTNAQTQKNSAEYNVNFVKNNMEYQGWTPSQKNSPGTIAGSRVIAPISGIVIKKFAEIGTMVGPSSPNPIITISTVNPVKIQINAEEKLLSYIKIGQTVPVKVDAWPDQVFDGHITKILPEVDPVSRTLTIEISVANSSRKLMPGMFAKINLVRQSVSGVTSIPIKAILEDGQGKYVYLVDKGKAILRRIQTGLSDEEYLQVVDGIKSGDQLIIAGHHSVENESKVEVIGGLKK